jgi:hypothetical protein
MAITEAGLIAAGYCPAAARLHAAISTMDLAADPWPPALAAALEALCAHNEACLSEGLCPVCARRLSPGRGCGRCGLLYDRDGWTHEVTWRPQWP